MLSFVDQAEECIFIIISKYRSARDWLSFGFTWRTKKASSTFGSLAAGPQTLTSRLSANKTQHKQTAAFALGLRRRQTVAPILLSKNRFLLLKRAKVCLPALARPDTQTLTNRFELKRAHRLAKDTHLEVSSCVAFRRPYITCHLASFSELSLLCSIFPFTSLEIFEFLGREVEIASWFKLDLP